MSLSRALRVCLAVAALAAAAAGAGGGRAATLALTRAVAHTGQSVAEIKGDAQLPALQPDLRDYRTE
jgi:hypothetical protein